MKVLIVICMVLISVAASAQEKKPAKTIQQKDGKTTSNRGEVAPDVKKDIGCISITNANNKMIPPDLYKSAKDCIKVEKFENASDLFSLAGLYASFDAARISDKSAGQAKAVLIKNTFDGLSDETRHRFSAVLTERLRKNKVALQDLCSNVAKIGYPTYHPDYMISQGNKTVAGSQNKAALSENFDPVATWNKLFETSLHCPPTAAP